MGAPVLQRGHNGSESLQEVLQSMYYDLKTLPTYTVATLPAAATASKGLAFCSNGAAGQPAIVYNDGTAWKVVGTIGAVAATS